jgi:DNA invertase Pin-like site-specific DNA recombinase
VPIDKRTERRLRSLSERRRKAIDAADAASDELANLVQDTLADGASVQEIANALDVTRQRVYAFMQARGLRPPRQLR